MNAFTDAAAALHADSNLSRLVRYRIGGAGAGVDIRVIWSEPLREADFASTGAVVKDIKADVQLSDIAQPAKGDTLELLEDPNKGAVFKVAAPPLSDTENVSAGLVLKLVS